jgi:cell division protein FtsI/penicillin-binding protein 2
MPTRARLLAVTVAATVALTTAVACGSDHEPERTLRAFLAGWPTGDLAGVPFTAPDGTPVPSAEVADQIAELSGELRELVPAGDLGELSVGDGVARAEILVEWPLAGGEDPPVWSYRSTVRAAESDGDWRVIWEPAVIHPDLVAGDALAVQRTAATRADILDGDGRPLVTARPVRDIGVWPSRVTDVDALVTSLDVAFEEIGVDLDETLAGLPARIEDAREDDLYVPVVTLREDDFTPISSLLARLDGVLLDTGERHLAPTRTFARALLGTVGPVTAEIMDGNPGLYEVGDHAGQGGLSERYEARLRGVPGQTVLIARTAPDGTVNHTELFTVDPVPGTDLRITLDPAVQGAAERALHGDDRRAALVAIRVSDGAVLAVANTRGPAANPVNLAFTGAVPPGSTFKMVTAYALLAAGEVTLDTMVDCPRELTVQGRTFRNADNLALGEVPFRENVARSCNTAFASLAPLLGAGGLAAAGAELGLGGDWQLGVETFTGQVSTGGDAPERAAAAFGQGTTLVSPVAMAAAAAAVARGAWHPPVLVLDPEAPAPEPVPLDPGVVAELHTALRSVVTAGTASALADLPGADVFGKTGSAEAGEQTHGWFVGWQDDLAFAVFVEDGGSGSGSAVPLAGRFLRDLP